MTSAWMIRNDGLEIPVVTHVYGTPEDEYYDIDDENTYVATFLLKHGKTTNAVIDKYFIVYFSALIRQGVDPEQYIKELPYRAVFDDSNEYLSGLWNKYKSLVPQTINKYDVAAVNRDINHELNQAFLRARVGGRYDTVPGNKDAYFRISSAGFIWDTVIDTFLRGKRSLISTVTIERDSESTGSNKMYTTRKGSIIDHMPLETFLEESEGEIDALESFPYTEDSVCRYGPRLMLRQGLREGMTMVGLCAGIFKSIDKETLYNDYAKLAYKENTLHPALR
jgi:hypothetical protein